MTEAPVHLRARDLLVTLLQDLAAHQPPNPQRLRDLVSAADDPGAVGYLLGVIDSHDARRKRHRHQAKVGGPRPVSGPPSTAPFG